ncbi:type II secretion system F family protein [Candidatus Micrarchaeota archaeon]|nr:type II secretion system F family protein [Candidatus Micrarchaeota archaeon]
MPRIRLYYILSQIFPNQGLQSIEKMIVQAGFTTIDPRKYAGFMVIFTIAAAIVAAIVINQFYPDPLWMGPAAGLFSLIVVGGTFYIVLYMSAENRAMAIEENLPEALRIISANIRAGMTIENAVWSVSKPEFGVLGEEIKRVSVGVYGGKPIQQSLMEMGERVDSKILQRSVKLLSEGITLGGEIANLLDSVSDNIKQTKNLRKEIRNATLSYTLFIVFSAILVAPMLFSVSLYYAETNERIAQQQQAVNFSNIQQGGPGSQFAGGGISSMAFQNIQSEITAKDIRIFALSAISITAFFSALLIGLIQHGKARWGLKLVPIFIIVSIGIFFFVRSMLGAAFGSIIGSSPT